MVQPNGQICKKKKERKTLQKSHLTGYKLVEIAVL